MHTINCLVPLLALAWDGGNVPLDRKAADALRASLGPRELQVMLLSPPEQKRYDAALAGARQTQQTGHVDVDKLQAARQFFKEAAIQLQFKQETKALEAQKQGLSALLDRWDAKPKWPASDLALLQGQFETLAKPLQQDPQLVLTLLHDLDEQYVLVRAKIKQRGAPQQALAPLAKLWLNLTQADKVSKEDWDIATFWAPLLGPEAFSNRKLSERDRTQYLIELNGVGINYQQAVLSEPARLRTVGASAQQIQAAQDQRDLLTASDGRGVRNNRQLQDAVTQSEGINRADIRFLESAVHMKYGQEQKALLAFSDGAARLSQAAAQFPQQAAIVRQHGSVVADQIAEQEPLVSQPIKKLLWASVPNPPCSKQKPQETLDSSRF